MTRIICTALLMVVVFAMAVPVVSALVAPQDKEYKEPFDQAKALNNAALALAIGLGFGLAVLGGALGQGKAIASSVEAMARQPEAGGRIFAAMIIGLALIETLVIYLLVLSFILIGNFATPPAIGAN